MGIISQGWAVEYSKLFVYLKDKYRTKEIYIFLGYLKKMKKLYSKLESIGYNLVFKEAVVQGENKIKANIDVELTIYVSCLFFDQYDKAVVISGDGDFKILYEYLLERNKLLNIIIPNRKKSSRLLKDFDEHLIYLEHERNKIEKGGRRSTVPRR